MENYKVIEYKKDEIKPASYNPRSITDTELEGLKESIKKFGLVENLIVNKKTGTLLSGHQRYKAACILGYETFPVVEVDLSLSEEKALNVVLNSQHISGQYDEEILKDLLKEIKIDLPEYESLRLDLYEIDTLDTSEVTLPDLGDGSDPDMQQVTFTLSNEQKDLLDQAMDKARLELDCVDQINQNKNGNIISAVARYYIGR